jgi:hypothetical protein
MRLRSKSRYFALLLPLFSLASALHVGCSGVDGSKLFGLDSGVDFSRPYGSCDPKGTWAVNFQWAGSGSGRLNIEVVADGTARILAGSGVSATTGTYSVNGDTITWSFADGSTFSGSTTTSCSIAAGTMKNTAGDMGTFTAAKGGSGSSGGNPGGTPLTEGAACTREVTNCDVDCQISCGTNPRCTNICCPTSQESGVVCSGQCVKSQCDNDRCKGAIGQTWRCYSYGPSTGRCGCSGSEGEASGRAPLSSCNAGKCLFNQRNAICACDTRQLSLTPDPADIPVERCETPPTMASCVCAKPCG